MSALPGPCSTPEGTWKPSSGTCTYPTECSKDQVAVPVLEVRQQDLLILAHPRPRDAPRGTSRGAGPCRRPAGSSRPRPSSDDRRAPRAPDADADGVATGRDSRRSSPGDRGPSWVAAYSAPMIATGVGVDRVLQRDACVGPRVPGSSSPRPVGADPVVGLRGRGQPALAHRAALAEVVGVIGQSEAPTRGRKSRADPRRLRGARCRHRRRRLARSIVALASTAIGDPSIRSSVTPLMGTMSLVRPLVPPSSSDPWSPSGGDAAAAPLDEATGSP